MDRDITPYVMHEAFLEDHRTDGLRSGEGALAPVGDGSLLLVYGRFEGGGDADRATLVQRFSKDGGFTWSEPEVFVSTPPEALNLMSVSLLGLADGRIGAAYLQKNSARDDCRPYFLARGAAEIRWSAPVRVIQEPGYFVVNNDRLIQLSNGRLLLPFAAHGRLSAPRSRAGCGCAISDDGGSSWRVGQRIAIEPRHVARPRHIEAGNVEAMRVFHEGRVQCQEPGVVECGDGRVMMWCRSTGGYAYRAWSDNGGEDWSPFQVLPEFAMPCGPQSIKRLPGSDRMVMLFNDRGDMPFGAPQFMWRRPLTVAVSDDEGQTWRRHGLLEPDTVPSTCYYSMAFHGRNALFTYYEGVMRTNQAGYYVPRNLASLKLKIVSRSYFLEEKAQASHGIVE